MTKVSGFTIARNVIKYNYPILESINSILPICDEFVVNVGDSEDGTLELIQNINSPKIKIIENKWDLSKGKEVLSDQTNLALKACQYPWAFYLQSDEVIHQNDHQRILVAIQKADERQYDAVRFKWLHFYGSYHRYRIDQGWFQKQDRIIRNNGDIVSYGDAYGFKRKNNKPLKRLNTFILLYHYGWVQTETMASLRRENAQQLGYCPSEQNHEKLLNELQRFEPYFGSHPEVMIDLIENHQLSQIDYKRVKKSFWYHPFNWLHLRMKTYRRLRTALT